MTQNQISFLNYEETKRSNLANERLKGETNEITRSHYRADEAIQSRKNDISEYANLITRGHYERMDRETKRSNKAREAIQSREADIRQQEVDTSRMNAETNKSHLAVDWYNAATNRTNASTNYANYLLGKEQLGETKRHNIAQETELNRSNVASEKIKEAQRQDQAQHWQQQDINQAYINEANASHLALQDKYIPIEQERKNYETSSKIKVNEADTALKKEQKEKTVAEKKEKDTKSIKNLVDAGKGVLDIVNDMTGRNRKAKKKR